MDVNELAARVRADHLGPASADAVERQMAWIAKRLDEFAGDFGYDPADLGEDQAEALRESYSAERTLPEVDADDIREIHDAHDAGAVPHNDDVSVLTVDPSLWEEYLVMNSGEAETNGYPVLYTAVALAERLAGAPLDETLAEQIAWEVTSEVAPG